MKQLGYSEDKITMEEKSVKQTCLDAVRKHFREHPFEEPFKLKKFEPQAEALLANLYDDHPHRPDISKDPLSEEGHPCLLLYDLGNESHRNGPIYQYIEDNRTHPNGLYGTSGAGKTRSIYEYLSLNYGLYFVSSTTNDAGSGDLRRLLKLFEAQSVKYKIHEGDPDRGYSVRNYDTIYDYVRILTFVRNVIFKEINAELKSHGHPKLTAYQWLLVQLYPEQALHGDLFSDIFSKCLVVYLKNQFKDPATQDEDRLDITISLIDEETIWSVVAIDEAQNLTDQLKDYFRGVDNGKRSAFSALLKAFDDLAITRNAGFPIFSGTGMPFNDFKTESTSIIAKRPLSKDFRFVFMNFEPLKANQVESYLTSVLGTRFINRSVDRSVIEHVSKWLRGRPRWTASFLEVYLCRSKISGHEGTRGKYQLELSANVMEALDRYLSVMTEDKKTGKKGSRKSFIPKKGSAYAAYVNAVDERKVGYGVTANLERAVFRFVVTGKPSIIKEDMALLIKTGIAAVEIEEGDGDDIDEVYIDEPIMIQAGINYYGQESFTNHLLQQEHSGQGGAFERLMLPAIRRNLGKILQEQLAEDDYELLQDYRVPTRSAYGVLAADCRNSIESTLKWIEDASKATIEGQVPPFCYPDPYIGPDLLFFLWNIDWTNFLSSISQAKFREDFSQIDALRTITPDLLYHENRAGSKGKEPTLSTKLTEELKARWDKIKPKLLGEEHGPLRLMVQYPAEQKKNADPGRVTDDASTVHECNNGESEKRKYGWISTISQENGGQFFGSDPLRVLKRLKKK